MQAVAPVVDRDLVRRPVQLEPAPGDPVGETADRGPEVGVVVLVAGDGVVAQQHVDGGAVAVGGEEGVKRRPVGEHAHLQDVGAQHVPLHLAPVLEPAERCGANRSHDGDPPAPGRRAGSGAPAGLLLQLLDQL